MSEPRGPYVSAKRAFLASADLGEDPDARLGRRKRAKLKAAEYEEKKEAGTLTAAAEDRPRTQGGWLEEERKQSKLPTVRDDEGAEGATHKAAPDMDGAVGKKKAKRLAQLSAKKAKQQQQIAFKEAAALAAATGEKAKKKEGGLSPAAKDLLARCKGNVMAQQRTLAIVAERVASDPEKNLDLFPVFLELHVHGGDERTRQMALITAVAVFKDLVPGYRIREPTEQEKQVQRSREVIALERQEMGLLSAYKRLLPLLEAAMRRDPLVFAPALAAMTLAASEFNYRQRLIGTAVKHATSSHKAVREVVAEALREMVEADQRLESSREVVLAIGRLAQSTASARRKGSKAVDETFVDGDPDAKARGLSSELFKVLLHLPFGKAEAAARQDMANRDADDETKRGLAEASIIQDPERLRKSESELLMEIFCVYLRILKQRHLHSKDLMPAVLTGLARWGQQVNLELLLEILVELRCLVQESISQSNELVSLQGLHCTLVLLSGPSQALMTDVSWLADSFRSSLMLALPSLHSAHSESLEWPPRRCFFMEDGHFRASGEHLQRCLESDSVPVLVLKCLEAALKCPQAFGRASDASLAQLIENLFVLAAASDPRVGCVLLKEASLLLRKHNRLHSILDFEGGLFGLGGVTEKSISLVWHLQAITFSMVPELAKAGEALARTIPNRRVTVADLFPVKESSKWLSSEVVSHLAALTSVQTPEGFEKDRWRSKGDDGQHLARAKATTAFLSERDLEAVCANKGPMM